MTDWLHIHKEHAIGTLHWQYYDRLIAHAQGTRYGHITLTVLWQTDCTCTRNTLWTHYTDSIKTDWLHMHKEHAIGTLHRQYYDILIAHAPGTRYGHITLTILWQTDCTKQGTRYRHITLTVLWQTDCTCTRNTLWTHYTDSIMTDWLHMYKKHAKGTLHWQYYDRLIALNKEHAMDTLHWQYYDKLIAHAQGTRYGHITLTVLWQTDCTKQGTRYRHITLTVLWQTDCTCTRNTLWTHYTDSIMTDWLH